MTKTFYSIDRSPHIVAARGHAAIDAWTVLAARNGFIEADPARRQALTAKEAATLCKKFYGCTLSEALGKGLI